MWGLGYEDHLFPKKSFVEVKLPPEEAGGAALPITSLVVLKLAPEEDMGGPADAGTDVDPVPSFSVLPVSPARCTPPDGVASPIPIPSPGPS